MWIGLYARLDDNRSLDTGEDSYGDDTIRDGQETEGNTKHIHRDIRCGLILDFLSRPLNATRSFLVPPCTQ